MKNNELFVRRIEASDVDSLFLGLSEPYFADCGATLNPHRIAHLVYGDSDDMYAVYEPIPNIVATQFVLDGSPLAFGEKRTVHFMSLDAIRLIKDLGGLAINNVAFSVDSIVFTLIDEESEYQPLIKINLKKKN